MSDVWLTAIQLVAVVLAFAGVVLNIIAAVRLRDTRRMWRILAGCACLYVGGTMFAVLLGWLPFMPEGGRVLWPGNLLLLAIVVGYALQDR